ncbi:helix-turn-helix transcriptional regulator [Planctomycetales bacterium ZRK34]|nr:helix-turn-helix transcriptional regulator [Planctomycetales bacterium ZRK34]
MSHTLSLLRDCINRSGKSRYAISKETGISQSHLSRFMDQKSNLSFEMAEKLAELLGYEFELRRISKK